MELFRKWQQVETSNQKLMNTLKKDKPNKKYKRKKDNKEKQKDNNQQWKKRRILHIHQFSTNRITNNCMSPKMFHSSFV